MHRSPEVIIERRLRGMAARAGRELAEVIRIDRLPDGVPLDLWG